MRVITWNVDGLQKMLARRQEPLHSVLKQLSADVVCIQETQLTKKDKGNLLDLASVPGWHSYFGLCRSKTKSAYAGVVTFCRDSVPVLAAEEGLAGTNADGVSDKICFPPDPAWESFSRAELEENDNEGRAVITDHGSFVLFNLYGCAVTDVEQARFARKLSFYKTLELRMEHLLAAGRAVLVVGDLNIAQQPVDRWDLAALVKLPEPERSRRFLDRRPDRKWFIKFLGNRRLGAPTDVFRRCHPDRRKAFTQWHRGRHEHNQGSRVDYIISAEPQPPTNTLASEQPETAALEKDPQERRPAAADSLEHGLEPASARKRGTDAVLLASAPAEREGAWLEHIKECDIMTDWKGSDHAPVWVDVDIPSLAPVSGPLRMESSARFAGGQRQTKLTDWIGGTKGTKRKHSALGGDETPPRLPLGAE